MTLEQSASLVNTFNTLPFEGPLVPEGYYRSKLFIVPFTTNPLVSAAGPLLSLLERLCVTPSLRPLPEVRENIVHELQAFHSRLKGQSYTDELIRLAHYLLTATIDELLAKSFLRIHGEYIAFTAFTPPSTDDVGPEKRFFEIVEFIKDRPHQYLDVIEVAYYCLIAGFEGDLHTKANGRFMLDNLLDTLFELIKRYRVAKPHQLFHFPGKVIAPPQPRSSSWLLTISVSLGLLIVGYGLSFGLLQHKVHELKMGYATSIGLDK